MFDAVGYFYINMSLGTVYRASERCVLFDLHRSCIRPVRRNWAQMSRSSIRSSVLRATTSYVRCSTSTRTLLTRASSSPSRTRCLEIWNAEWSQLVKLEGTRESAYLRQVKWIKHKERGGRRKSRFVEGGKSNSRRCCLCCWCNDVISIISHRVHTHTHTERMTYRMTNLLISSNVHYVHLAEIITYSLFVYKAFCELWGPRITVL